jgi:hypothetical protein
MSLDLAFVVFKFPKKRLNSAVCGPIPIMLFTVYEKDFREMIRREKLRVIYRGPRVSNNNAPGNKPSMTRRCDAVSVLLYRK